MTNTRAHAVVAMLGTNNVVGKEKEKIRARENRAKTKEDISEELRSKARCQDRIKKAKARHL